MGWGFSTVCFCDSEVDIMIGRYNKEAVNMEIREEALVRILNGVETVLDTEGMLKEVRRKKLEEVAIVFGADSETAGRLAQEIVKKTENKRKAKDKKKAMPMLDSDAFTEGLDDLSEKMKHSDHDQL